MTYPREIEFVLFDLDNTLLDRNAALRRYSIELYTRRNIISQFNTQDEATELIMLIDEDGLKPREKFIDGIIERWPGIFDGTDEGMRHYEDTYPLMNALDPRTKQMLTAIQSRDIPCGIVTNGAADRQMSKVHHTGLTLFVKSVVVSEAVNMRKPDPLIFEYALNEIGANPEKTLFVGDNPEADILGAKTLGMYTAWLHRGRDWAYQDKCPDYVLDHPAEVERVILG